MKRPKRKGIYLSVPSVKDDSRKLSTNCRLTCHSPGSKFIRAAKKIARVLVEGRKVIASTLKLIDFNNIKIDCDSPVTIEQINPADVRVRILFDKDYKKK